MRRTLKTNRRTLFHGLWWSWAPTTETWVFLSTNAILDIVPFSPVNAYEITDYKIENVTKPTKTLYPTLYHAYYFFLMNDSLSSGGQHPSFFPCTSLAHTSGFFWALPSRAHCWEFSWVYFWVMSFILINKYFNMEIFAQTHILRKTGLPADLAASTI